MKCQQQFCYKTSSPPLLPLMLRLREMVRRKKFLFLVVFVCLALLIYSNLTANISPNVLHRTLFGFAAQNLKINYDNLSIYKEAYLVYTSRCKIVNWPPFDEQVISLYQNKSGRKLVCKKGFTSDISITRHSFSAINIVNKSNINFQCYRSNIIRKTGDDNTLYFTPSFELNNGTNYFDESATVVKVSCMINNGHRVLEKVVPLIPYIKTKTQPPLDMPNILFIGLDSISRINFDRHFPLTKKILEKHSFYTMYGYNKVADNTFVNLTPLLTGHYLEELWNETVRRKVFLDYFPFIWKDYESLGYHTLLIEDAPAIATFNYLKSGFSEQPTTYYMRPYSLAVEDDIRKHCYLDRSEVETYFDYLYDFINAMKVRHQKYFAFTFLARLTHNHLNDAGMADPMVEMLFNKLFNENLLSNTVLIFFSDHGIRFGKIRHTLIGKLEERLPFMHIYLPKHMRNRNIEKNQHRLTTPFDIHATLAHIAYKGAPNESMISYGQTLLDEVSETRGCSDIPILDHWCACQQSERIANLTLVKPIAQFIVNNVNELLEQRYSDRCVKLELTEIMSAYEQHLSDKVVRFVKSMNDVIDRHVIYSKNPSVMRESSKHYMITVRVKPSDAVLEATVKLNQLTGVMTLVGDVSRINEYGSQSQCINDQFLRRYCFCDYQLTIL